jgi:hypothetical protein
MCHLGAVPFLARRLTHETAKVLAARHLRACIDLHAIDGALGNCFYPEVSELRMFHFCPRDRPGRGGMPHRAIERGDFSTSRSWLTPRIHLFHALWLSG